MVTFVTFVAIFLLRESIKPGWLRLLLIGFVSTLLIAIQFVLFGLSSDERCMIKNIKNEIKICKIGIEAYLFYLVVYLYS